MRNMYKHSEIDYVSALLRIARCENDQSKTQRIFHDTHFLREWIVGGYYAPGEPTRKSPNFGFSGKIDILSVRRINFD